MAATLLQPRPVIAGLAPYRPPLGGRAGLLLDFNENARGPSPAVLERLRELDAECLSRYPDRAPGERIGPGVHGNHNDPLDSCST